MTPDVRYYDSRGHTWRAIPGTPLLRREDGVEMPRERVLDVFGYGAGTATAYLLGRFDRAALDAHTADVDYLRGAEDALDDIQRQLALAMVGKEEITAAYVAGMLRRTGIELGVQHGERHREDA